ncbi:unnamed protein product [Rhizophagus irregularis]|nr:unnamed protein product [Rhizophagus irregularis]
MSGEVEPDNDIEIKKGGRPRAVIWNFFIEGPDQGDGHRSAICSACNTTWKRGKASAMERHILLDCKKVKTEVREAIRYNEILRVNTEIYQLIKKEKNLTLSIDGWTSPAGKSLWNFVIHTPDGKDVLWQISDLSD